MKLYCLFIQRKEPYDGAYGPELLTAWDQFSVDENGVGFNEDCKKSLALVGDDVESHAVITIEVPMSEVMAVLRPEVVIQGTILKE